MTLPDEPFLVVIDKGVVGFNPGALIRFADSSPTKTASRLLYFLAALEGVGETIPDQSSLASRLGVTRQSISLAVSHLRLHGFWLPQWGKPERHENVECVLRDRLHQDLGGLTEVMTPIGRIDLLPDTEIIEVKRYSDWKGALGQILAYSSFYPAHQKRLHLFAMNQGMSLSADVLNICESLDVIVTFETVEEVENDG